jgi:hypothetical protein
MSEKKKLLYELPFNNTYSILLQDKSALTVTLNTVVFTSNAVRQVLDLDTIVKKYTISAITKTPGLMLIAGVNNGKQCFKYNIMLIMYTIDTLIIGNSSSLYFQAVALHEPITRISHLIKYSSRIFVFAGTHSITKILVYNVEARGWTSSNIPDIDNSISITSAIVSNDILYCVTTGMFAYIPYTYY